jgi:hypothetical protein
MSGNIDPTADRRPPTAEHPPLATRHSPLATNHWPLITFLILLLAAAFRLVALPDLPPGLAQDEVLDADIALFIRGGEHALFFRHGYGHEPLYHYLAAPFAPLLGDNWLAIRLPSVYLGLLLVALTMRWARRDYGAAAALVAGLGLAISWWPVVFSRIGIRPILAPLLLVAAVWFWPLRRTTVTRRGLLSAALAGLWLGLAIYSYTAARVAPLIPTYCYLLIVVLVAAGPLALRQRAEGRATRHPPPATRPQIVYAAVVLAVSLLLYLPLGLTLRANPELQQRLEQLEGPLDALAAGDAGPVARAALATLGVFSAGGDPRWTYSLPGRPLFDPLTALLFYAGLGVALWRWRRPVYALLPVWLAVALLPSALSPDAPSTVRLVGALPVVYLLPGLAVAAVGARLKTWAAAGQRRAARRALAGVVLVAAVLLLAANGWRTVGDARRWSAELETRLRYQTALRDIARHWQADDAGAPVVAEVFYEPIDGASLRRSVGRDLLARWVQTGGGVAGALVWPAGQTAARLYVPEYAPLDGELAKAAGLGAPVFRSTGQPSFAVYALPAAPVVELTPATASFGVPPAIALRGFAPLNATQAVGEGQLRLLSAWEVLAPLPPDAAIFVHLSTRRATLSPSTMGWMRRPRRCNRATGCCSATSCPCLPWFDGDYTVVIGLYRRGDGSRLATVDGGSAPRVARLLAWRGSW